jgi:hypothetical protein
VSGDLVASPVCGNIDLKQWALPQTRFRLVLCSHPRNARCTTCIDHDLVTLQHGLTAAALFTYAFSGLELERCHDMSGVDTHTHTHVHTHTVILITLITLLNLITIIALITIIILTHTGRQDGPGAGRARNKGPRIWRNRFLALLCYA